MYIYIDSLFCVVTIKNVDAVQLKNTELTWRTLLFLYYCPYYSYHWKKQNTPIQRCCTCHITNNTSFIENRFCIYENSDQQIKWVESLNKSREFMPNKKLLPTQPPAKYPYRSREQEIQYRRQLAQDSTLVTYMACLLTALCKKQAYTKACQVAISKLIVLLQGIITSYLTINGLLNSVLFFSRF